MLVFLISVVVLATNKLALFSISKRQLLYIQKCRSCIKLYVRVIYAEGYMALINYIFMNGVKEAIKHSLDLPIILILLTLVVV